MKFLLPAAFFVLGLAGGWFWRTALIAIPQDNMKLEQTLIDKEREIRLLKESSQRWKEKFQEIADVDVEEYLALKDLEKKYHKAEEIFGKILLVFFADIGLRMGPKGKDLVQRYSEISPPMSEVETNEVADNNEISKGGPNVTSQKLPATSTQDQLQGQKLQIIEQEVTKIRTPAEMSEFLKKVDLQEPEKAFYSSSALSNVTGPALHLVNGQFNGTITFLDKKQIPVEVRLHFFGESDGKKLTGEHLVELSKEGKPFSTSRGSGDLSGALRQFSDSTAILVPADDKAFFQLYYLPESDSFIGNFYEKTKSTPYKKTGTVQLNR